MSPAGTSPLPAVPFGGAVSDAQSAIDEVSATQPLNTPPTSGGASTGGATVASPPLTPQQRAMRLVECCCELVPGDAGGAAARLAWFDAMGPAAKTSR
eukprot:3414090-Prymnesium_polylepis.1